MSNKIVTKCKNQFKDSGNILIVIVLSVIYSSSLFPAEIVLKDDTAFIGDIKEETPARIVFSYQGKIYEIPQNEILVINKDKTGEHTSFRYTSFQLRDKSEIRGVVAEETNDAVTVRTQTSGFMLLKKADILKRSSSEKTPPVLTENWKFTKENSGTQIGLKAGSYQSSGDIASNNPNGINGGFLIEPEFTRISTLWRVGFVSEYLYAKGKKSEYSFQNNSIYLQRIFKSTNYPLLDFYANLGLGVSYIRYTSYSQPVLGVTPESLAISLALNRPETYTGNAPLGFLELGWQGLKTGSFTHRFSARGMSFYDKEVSTVFYGFEYSLVYKL
ncbi:MAG: hypothetical protein SFU98_11735 [Leptospiraceae bacterium]|nr:hypothetical protein [Leptospiraceae bacterium]